MRYLITLILLVLINSKGSSQNFLVEENNVQIYVNKQGDTLVFMRYESAKILLTEVLECEYSDSILTEYMLRDSIKNNVIALQKDKILSLSKKGENYTTIIKNLNTILGNKNYEIELKDKEIKKHLRKLKTQKTLTKIGFSLAGALPIITAVLLILL